jgi:hypothetical protein
MMRVIALLLLVPMFAACDEESTGPDTSHVGVYQLQTVNGQQVPVSFEEEGGVFTVTGATLRLNADGTFSMMAEFSTTVEGDTTNETDTLTGTYTRSGNTVTFVHSGEDEGFETGTLSGDLLTTSGGGDEALVFEK